MEKTIIDRGKELAVNPNLRAVRLHHPTLRNCIFTIEDQARIYPSPYSCPTCLKEHIFKTIHLNLDANGDVTVATSTYDYLKAQGGLEELKATKEVVPRPFVLDMARRETPEIIIAREHGTIKI